MRTLDLIDFRRQSYGRAMRRVLDECDRLGVAELWNADLRRLPTVRAAALTGRTETLGVWIGQAIHLGTAAGFTDAVGLLCERRAELHELNRDAARLQTPAVPVVVLDEDWGKKGRGVKIRAWIVETAATWQDVAARFQLAESTSRRYVREANRAARGCGSVI